MVVIDVTANNCTPQTIVIGRRGTYDTMQIAFDLSYLVEAYGSGVAVLAVKRSQDESAYPAVVTQENNTLTWTVSETDTAYVGAGEAQLMWYVDGGLAKTIIYPMVVMKDILQTAEEPPDGYENWIESLTELGAETLQNAQDAAQSASDAESAKDDAITAKEAAEEAASMLQNVSATATTLEPNQPATASYNDGVFSFGIPKGDKGDKMAYADLTEADKLDLIQGPIAEAQDAAEQAVEEKGEEVLDSLPQDYIQLESHFESLEDNIVLVQDTQPSSEDNRIWVDPNDNDIEIPTMDEAKEMMSASHGGICNEWNLTSTAKATLYNDGLLYLHGSGAVTFTAQNPAPWLSDGYETQVHKIVISDNVNLTDGSLAYAFTKFDSSSNPIYGKTSYDGRLDINNKMNAFYPSAFGQFDYRHVNYRCTQPPTGSNPRLLVPNSYKRAVCSVPQAICSEALINNVKYRIQTIFAGYDNTGSCLFITDSEDFYNAVYDATSLQPDAVAQTACILCDNLGSDGFPDYWTEPMKRVFPEIMPYVGRQLTYYKDSNAEKDGVFYPYRGPMSSLGNYSGYGWPTPFSANAQLTVYINHVGTSYFEKYADFPGNSLSYYLGQPMSPALDELATGVSCSGLICWLYWRYFGENFALSASNEFNRLTGKIGNHLPLVEIQESELAPFDIINMAIDVDHDDDIDELDHGGHCAIYLGSYTSNGVTKHKVLQCSMGKGIVFGDWAFDDAWFESHNQINTTKYLRLQKGGISANALSQPTA